MQAPYYENASRFSPGQTTINSWLKTRKSDGTIKPGLIETVDYPRDLAWSIFAILIEFSAFFLTLFGAWEIFKANHNLKMLITALILVVLFILFDIIGIMLHGQDKPEKVLLKSQLRITPDPIQKQFLIQEIEKITWRTFLGMLLLCFSGILKIISIAVYFKSQSGPAAVTVLIIFYLIVIYIHAYHTGYWWSARKVHKQINKDFESSQSHQKIGTPDPFLVNNPTIRLFQSPYTMVGNSKSLQSNRQNVELIQSTTNSDGTLMNEYRLSSNGLMWDSDVNTILMHNSHQFNQYLLEACIQLQLTQLNVFA
jgi:hypothetical protein